MSGPAALASRARGALTVLRCTTLLILGFLASCTDMWNEQGRRIGEGNYAVSHGDYVSAHEYFATAAKEAKDLSPRELRQVMDGLCLTEYQIGPLSYPLARQLRNCSEALNEPESESGPIFREVARKERAALTETIDAELARHDIATFDDTVVRYRSVPGSSPEAVAQWTGQAWTIIDREGQARPGRAALAQTISKLSHHLPNLRNMSDQQFRSWIEKNMTVAGTTLVSNIKIGKRDIDLWLGDNQIEHAAMNLDRFALVNNGLVVRCRCNAHTDVALDESDLPVYLVRLDAATRQSEVLILH